MVPVLVEGDIHFKYKFCFYYIFLKLESFTFLEEKGEKFERLIVQRLTVLPTKLWRIADLPCTVCIVSDPHTFFPDPDPGIFLNPDTDVDPGSKEGKFFFYKRFLTCSHSYI